MDYCSTNYHDITTEDMLNGDGMRTVVWMAGCVPHCKDEQGNPCFCKNCQNPVTQNASDGCAFTIEVMEEILEKVSKPWIQGLTLSGGDPLTPYNRLTAKAIVEEVKKMYPEKDIWLYTGYTTALIDGEFFVYDDNTEPEKIEWLKDVDIIVDGPFVQEIRDMDLKTNRKVYWRGSSNQRVIDVKKSLLVGAIVTHE